MRPQNPDHVRGEPHQHAQTSPLRSCSSRRASRPWPAPSPSTAAPAARDCLERRKGANWRTTRQLSGGCRVEFLDGIELVRRQAQTAAPDPSRRQDLATLSSEVTMTKVIFAALAIAVMGIASNGAVADEAKQPGSHILKQEEQLLSPVTVMAQRDRGCMCTVGSETRCMYESQCSHDGGTCGTNCDP